MGLSGYDINADLKAKILEKELPWFARLCGTWQEIGFDQDTVSKRIAALAMHLDKIWEGFVEEEEEIKIAIDESVSKLAREIAAIREELCLEAFEPPADASLFQLNQILPAECRRLKEEKGQRLEEIQRLLHLDDALADRLGISSISKSIDRNKVPSLDQISDAKQHINELKETIAARQTQFEDLRSGITEILENVGENTKVNFRNDLLCQDENLYDLSQDNLDALADYHQELRLLQSDRQNTIKELRLRFVQLWHRLALDEHEKEEILRVNQSCHLSVIENFQTQIHRLEELRIANLECFTVKIRDEIREWWDKCYLTEDERLDFEAINETEFTELLLDVHEAEVIRLREYYDKRFPIFVQIEGWNLLWNQFVDFDKRANDPNRFSKRGGGLLQEEKERKKFGAKFPKTEKQIEDDIVLWETEHGQEFCILGMRFIDYVEHVKEQYEVEKQQEKEARLKQRRGELKPEAVKVKPKTPTKRRIGTEKPSATASVSQVKTPTKRMKGDELTIPRSATFTKSPNNLSSHKVNGDFEGPQMTLTDMVPPPHPGLSRGRLGKRTPTTQPRKNHKRILSSSNSDEVLNGNVAISYKDFKRGVTSNHRSSSLTDLRQLLASSGVNGINEFTDGGKPGSLGSVNVSTTEKLDSNREEIGLDAKSFRDSQF